MAFCSTIKMPIPVFAMSPMASMMRSTIAGESPSTARPSA